MWCVGVGRGGQIETCYSMLARVHVQHTMTSLEGVPASIHDIGYRWQLALTYRRCSRTCPCALGTHFHLLSRIRTGYSWTSAQQSRYLHGNRVISEDTHSKYSQACRKCLNTNSIIIAIDKTTHTHTTFNTTEAHSGIHFRSKLRFGDSFSCHNLESMDPISTIL